jgi:hypothetical protein
MQQTRPEYGPSHVSHFAPVHSSCECRADDAAYACSRHYRRFDSHFTYGFDNADVREPAHSAATERQAYAFVLK